MKAAVSRLLWGGFLVLLLLVCLVMFTTAAKAADPLTGVSSSFNPLGDFARPQLPPLKRPTPGVVAANPFSQACPCGEFCQCDPLSNCGCDLALHTTRATIAPLAAGPNTFKPAAVRSRAPTYTVAPATARYGITSFGTGFATGGCANGQCGAAPTGRKGFLGFW